MTSHIMGPIGLVVASVFGLGLASLPGSGSQSTEPVVVELYQSQGCSSCPPANEILNRLADRRDILALSFSVTYWDQLGWKDTFANEAFTARQWDFARAQGRGNVATPQFVVAGRTIVSGSDPGALDSAMKQARTVSGGPQISVQGSRVLIGAAPAREPATVWLVRYDPRERLVSIGRGENSGRVLPHRNIVTGLRELGAWTGKPVSFAQPPYRDSQQRSAVLVQQGTGGPILSARVI